MSVTINGTSGIDTPAVTLPEGPVLVIESGTVIALATTTVPTGYLECNGSAISRTVYASLYAKIGATYGSGDGSTTFNIPDLRGEFLRGYDNGRGVDSGRVFGSSQLDAFQDHTHNYQAYRRAGASEQLYTPEVNFTLYTLQTTGASGRIAAETRPRNIAMMYCIKY